LILDVNGNLSLNGNTNDPRFFNPITLGTSRDVTTIFEDINNFIIAPGQTAHVLGTLIVKSKRTQIDGEINGTGGGFVGAVASTTADGTFGNPGESPSGTNGHGQGGMSRSGHRSGGGGGSHGKLLFLCLTVVYVFNLSYSMIHLLDIQLVVVVGEESNLVYLDGVMEINTMTMVAMMEDDQVMFMMILYL